MELTVPQTSANIIWKCSFLQIIPIISSIICKRYGCSICNTAICCTSLNYWRNPIVHSWRRYIDILTVLSSAAFHIHVVKDSNNSDYIYTATGVIMTLYPLSCFLQNINLETSVMCHCLLQVSLGIHTSYVYFNLL